MSDDELKAMIVSVTTDDYTKVEDSIDNSELLTHATNVMMSYQNANKWLDSIKEILLMEQGCIFFSTYIHELAHTMPVRFDKFGDILHTANIEVPYPTTEQLGTRPSDIPSAFEQIFNILDNICTALMNFIKATQDTANHAMACSAEELLVSIKGEYPHLYRMKKIYELCDDNIKFDTYVNHYMDNIDKLLG